MVKEASKSWWEILNLGKYIQRILAKHVHYELILREMVKKIINLVLWQLLGKFKLQVMISLFEVLIQ